MCSAFDFPTRNTSVSSSTCDSDHVLTIRSGQVEIYGTPELEVAEPVFTCFDSADPVLLDRPTLMMVLWPLRAALQVILSATIRLRHIQY
jgi:hypothetical protein